MKRNRDWIDAMQRPAGRQMQYLRALVESRPFFSRIPDQSLIVGDTGQGGQRMQAARDRDGSYSFVYFPAIDTYKTIDLGKLKGKRIRAWWFDPRTGIGTLIDTFDGGKQVQFHTPSYGPDWVLVLDDEAAKYPPPGLFRWGK
jgi:hypothetical protein